MIESIGFDSVELEYSPCTNGCEVGDDFIVASRDLLCGLPGTYTVVRCRKCDLMRTNPRPTADTISFYYPADYGPYLGTIIPNKCETTSAKWKVWLRGIFSSKSDITPEIAPGSMLEVGCASGNFLQRMKNKNWKVEGIEFSAEAAQNARSNGHKVFTGPLEAASMPAGEFDLIVAWMVLEHLHEPKKGLEKLHTWTAEKGYLVFSIPDASSLILRLMKGYSYNLQLPTHMYHFTPKTIAALLEDTGWKLDKITYQITMSSIMGSIGLWLRESGRDGKLAQWFLGYPTKDGFIRYIFFPLAYVLAVLGQTGRMTIWATKI